MCKWWRDFSRGDIQLSLLSGGELVFAPVVLCVQCCTVLGKTLSRGWMKNWKQLELLTSHASSSPLLSVIFLAPSLLALYYLSDAMVSMWGKVCSCLECWKGFNSQKCGPELLLCSLCLKNWAQGIELSLSKTLRLNELDVIGQKMKNSVKEVDASCSVVSSCAPQ